MSGDPISPVSPLPVSRGTTGDFFSSKSLDSTSQLHATASGNLATSPVVPEIEPAAEDPTAKPLPRSNRLQVLCFDGLLRVACLLKFAETRSSGEGGGGI